MSLLEFYGENCPHCIMMKPQVGRLEREFGVYVEKFEVWDNEENAKKKDELDVGSCGGVPFFYNTETKKFICGSTDYQSLKKWAQGE